MDSARSGIPALAIIEGPAGIGKSALVQRFVALTRRPRVLWAGGDPTERQVDFALADQLLRRAGRDGVLSATDHVAVGLELLALSAGEQATIVVIDDAHWADPPSLRALLFACRRQARQPVLTLLAARDGQP